MNTALTRQGARGLTEAIDRVATCVQDEYTTLGIDPKIAKDFAYRCDLISDAVETTAVHNDPLDKEAVEASDVTAKPGIQDEIGEVVKGPIHEEDPATSGDLKGQFTQFIEK